MRLIDADGLKKHIDKLPALPDGNFAGNHSALKVLIDMQPTIESSVNCSEFPNNWIPCSERLPEENGIYIVTEKVYSVEDTRHTRKYRVKVEPVNFYSGKFMRAPHFEVLAWMPLPEPYQEKEEES